MVGAFLFPTIQSKKMVNSQNNVTFKVGENIMNESFIDAFQASYFIEQSPFEIVASTINGEEKSPEESRRFASFVAPTEYMETMKRKLPNPMQEILGTIAWYQDMLDKENLRQAERMYEEERVFKTDCNF
jgi:hypothetical protein